MAADTFPNTNGSIPEKVSALDAEHAAKRELADLRDACRRLMNLDIREDANGSAERALAFARSVVGVDNPRPRGAPHAPK